jgi:hypothetical protein
MTDSVEVFLSNILGEMRDGETGPALTGHAEVNDPMKRIRNGFWAGLFLLVLVCGVCGTARPQGESGVVNVRQYGAKGDGASDDTAAIQGAIDAACRLPGNGGASIVYFPPAQGAGYYFITQPVGNRPVFHLEACRTTGITIEGGGTAQGAVQQFARSPMTRLLVQDHSSGGLGPVFLVGRGNNQVTFRDIQIFGYNQAVQLNNTTGAVFENVALAAGNSSASTGRMTSVCIAVDCTSDNVPLAIYSTFWVWADQMALQPPSYPVKAWVAGRVYSAGDVIGAGGYLYEAARQGRGGTAAPEFPTAIAASVQDGGISWNNVGPAGSFGAAFVDVGNMSGTGLIRFDKVTVAGGGFLFDQRNPVSFSIGSYEFHSVSTEASSTGSFFTVLNTGGGGTNRTIGPMQFENSAAYDCANGKPFLLLNAPRVTLTALTLENVSGCNVSAPLRIEAGAVAGLTIAGGELASRVAVDAAGKSVGPQATDNLNGRDYIVPVKNTDRLRTDVMNCCGLGTGADGTPIRMAPAGSRYATLGIDPGQAVGDGGILFGDGVSAGYSADVVEQKGQPGTLDIAFAEAAPPEDVSAMPNSKGVCAEGFYYYVVSSYTGSPAQQTVASAEVSARVPERGGVELKWTPAKGDVVSGYVVTRGSTPGREYGGGGMQYLVPGADSTSFIDTCTGGGKGSPPRYNQTFAAMHRFSGRKLGVDELEPQAQLDVAAEDAKTVGMKVRAAPGAQADILEVTDAAGHVRGGFDAGFNLELGRHLGQMEGNSDLAGKIEVRGSAGTHTFSTPFAGLPLCVATPTSDPGGKIFWVSTTENAVTVHIGGGPGSAGNQTMSFNYACFGGPK